MTPCAATSIPCEPRRAASDPASDASAASDAAPELERKLPALLSPDCAARLGLAYERRFTGYGDLETTLARVR